MRRCRVVSVSMFEIIVTVEINLRSNSAARINFVWNGRMTYAVVRKK